MAKKSPQTEEGPFATDGVEAEQVIPNGISRAVRGPPDNPGMANRSFGGHGDGTMKQTGRGLKGGE